MAKKAKSETRNNRKTRITKKDKKELSESLFKTYEEAVQITGSTLPSLEGLPKDIAAFAKLKVIAKALNIIGSVKGGASKYYPCFRTIKRQEESIIPNITDANLKVTKETIIGITPMRYGYMELSAKSVTYPLSICVKSPKLALYFAEQFTDVWCDYLGYVGLTIQNIIIQPSED